MLLSKVILFKSFDLKSFDLKLLKLVDSFCGSLLDSFYQVDMLLEVR